MRLLDTNIRARWGPLDSLYFCNGRILGAGVAPALERGPCPFSCELRYQDGPAHILQRLANYISAVTHRYDNGGTAARGYLPRPS
jgi:hypothetical protein